jgi:glucose-1-phosphatase
LLDLFDTVYFSNEIQRRKPGPEAFTYVLNVCGLQAQKTLFFDDIEENISGAGSVHITGILVHNPANISAELQKYGLIS